MNTARVLVLPFLCAVILPFFVAPVLAGGGLVMLNVTPNLPSIRLNPGEFYKVHATAYTDNSYTTRCGQCSITFKFQNSNDTDIITPASGETDSNGEASARMVSNILGDRLVFVEVEMPDGTIYTSSSTLLAYNPGPAPTNYMAPEMVYPQDNQTLDLEGAYMFKVKPRQGASGYLFGLFQDEIMIYENYRDAKTLSANGEFALWESNSAHSKFKTGPVKVMIRALIDNEWTDARTITIYLKPRGSIDSVPTIIPVPVPTSSPVLPTIPPSQTIIIVHDSSASAQLQKKVEELEQKLQESQQKQSALESRLEQIINWIKSIFPFFE